MQDEEQNSLNDPEAVYQPKSQVRFFATPEEANEADAKENATISPETHLRNASVRAMKIFSDELKKPMDKKIKFKDGHPD